MVPQDRVRSCTLSAQDNVELIILTKPWRISSANNFKEQMQLWAEKNVGVEPGLLPRLYVVGVTANKLPGFKHYFLKVFSESNAAVIFLPPSCRSPTMWQMLTCRRFTKPWMVSCGQLHHP